jgi:hypothetical protein
MKVEQKFDFLNSINKVGINKMIVYPSSVPSATAKLVAAVAVVSFLSFFSDALGFLGLQWSEGRYN